MGPEPAAYPAGKSACPTDLSARGALASGWMLNAASPRSSQPFSIFAPKSRCVIRTKFVGSRVSEGGGGGGGSGGGGVAARQPIGFSLTTRSSKYRSCATGEPLFQ